MSDRRWAERATHALLAAPSPLVEHQPGGRTRTVGGLTFSALTMKGPTFNTVAVTGCEPPSWDQIATLAQDFFGGDDPHSFGVILEGDAPANAALESDLRQRGWQIIEEEPALTLENVAARSTSFTPPKFAVDQVRTPEDLDLFFALVLEIFKLTPELLAGLATGNSALDDPRLFFLVGRSGGAPVSIVLGAMIEDVVTIHGVGTRSAFRGRGFGAAMTAAAVREGARRGATLAVLRTGPLSRPLYERLGFQFACLHRTWAKPEVGE